MPDSASTLGATEPARVLIVDDHPAVRRGLLDAIARADDLEVCGEAATVREAKQLVKEHRADVALVDITLEEGSGLELIKDLAAGKRPVKVLVLSMHDETLYAERALRAGAQGYLMKGEPLGRVVEGLRQVLSGQVCLSDRMSGRLLKRVVGGRDVDEGTSPVDALTDRELEVFDLIGRGRRTREIADSLHLSTKTVYTHCENIKRKLKLADATELHQRAFDWVRTEAERPSADTSSTG